MWVGGVADSQTRTKTPLNHPENRLFDLNFTFRSPKSYKTLEWVGGWVNTFGRDLKKKLFLRGASLMYLFFTGLTLTLS